jgi:hypothetical protein
MRTSRNKHERRRKIMERKWERSDGNKMKRRTEIREGENKPEK